MQKATPLHCALSLQPQTGSIFSPRMGTTLTSVMDRNLSSNDHQSIDRKSFCLVHTPRRIPGEDLSPCPGGEYSIFGVVRISFTFFHSRTVESGPCMLHQSHRS